VGWRKGYFRQEITDAGQQIEHPEDWQIDRFTHVLPPVVAVPIEGRTVYVGARQYNLQGVNGCQLPVILLTTDLAENDERARTITDSLYGGDPGMRLAQEMVLGIGGIKMLHALGYRSIQRFHLNEGHSALLVVELAKQLGCRIRDLPHQQISDSCIFTTHTPVPAGHDVFPRDLVRRVAHGYLEPGEIDALCRDGELNMTLLALVNSNYINGVAQRHRQVSLGMFPGYTIDSITNGVHHVRWASPPFQELYDRQLPGWREDPHHLRCVMNFHERDIWEAHLASKKLLLDCIKYILA